MNIGFTSRAAGAVERAIESARELGHTCVGTEHILLGLLSVEDGIASKALSDKGVTYEKVYDLVGQMSGVGERTNVSFSSKKPRHVQKLPTMPRARSFSTCRTISERP